MRKKLVVTMIVLITVMLVILVMTVPALAKRDKPHQADGIWKYIPVGLEPIEFDPYVGVTTTLFLAVPYTSTWTGTFDGPSWDYGLAITHDADLAADPPGNIGAPMLFADAASFKSVKVCDATGDLEMDALGDRPDASADWTGTWVITSGTGDLANLEGHGTFWGPGYLGGPEMGIIYYWVDELELDGVKCHKDRGNNAAIIRE